MKTDDKQNFSTSIFDEELTEGVTYIHTTSTLLSKDIIADCGKTYEVYNHALCIYVVYDNRVIPVTVSSSPVVMSNDVVFPDILDFVKANETLLKQFADMEIDEGYFFDALAEIRKDKQQSSGSHVDGMPQIPSTSKLLTPQECVDKTLKAIRKIYEKPDKD